MSRPPIGQDSSILAMPTETIRDLELESEKGGFAAGTVARLPKFLRSFYLRFLDETLDLEIERFTVEERDQISDLLVDLESEGDREASWPLLSDFVDLCDYFDDFGLLSVPEAAQEHEPEIFELSARVLQDFGWWATEEGHETLHTQAQALASKLESLGSGAKAR